MMFNWLRTWIASIRARREARELAGQALELKRAKANLAGQRRRERERRATLARACEALSGPFVIADLETTGLSSSDEIINIAAIRVDEFGEVSEEYAVLIRIRKPLPRFIVELTGITDRMLAREGVGLRVALEEFFAFCQNDPVFFHNASYDTRMLEAACEKTSMMFTNEVFCSLKLARIVWPQLQSHKLEVLARYLGIPAPSHLAIDDVRALRHVLEVVHSEASMMQAA